MRIRIPAFRVISVTAAVAIVIGLAGCATPGGPGADAGTADPSSPPPVSAPATDPAGGSGEESAETGGDDAAAAPGAYVDYADGIIEATPGTKVLFFHASWCPKCRALEESILSSEIPDGLTIIKADFDTATELRQRYGVTLQTTIVYVDDDGEQLSSAVLYDETTLDALLAAAP